MKAQDLLTSCSCMNAVLHKDGETRMTAHACLCSGVQDCTWWKGAFTEVLHRHCSLHFIKCLARLPWWPRQSRICLQCRGLGFCLWVRKIPRRREWLPTPVLLPGEFHGQRNLMGMRLQRGGHDWATQLKLLLLQVPSHSSPQFLPLTLFIPPVQTDMGFIWFGRSFSSLWIQMCPEIDGSSNTSRSQMLMFHVSKS